MNGWKFNENRWYFYKNNQPVKGWYRFTAADGEDKEHWSFFDKNTGVLYTGWHYMTSNEGEKKPHWCYFGKNGWLRTGWVWLTQKDDNEDVNHWSYFGSNGWLRTGWVYFDKVMGETTPHWSFFGQNGWLRTGLVRLSKADGEAQEHLSYFDNKGWLKTNCEVSANGKKYKADSRGWLTEMSGGGSTPSGIYTYGKFISTHVGKATDYDGRFGAQCVDLIKSYLNLVWGIKPGSWGNAWEYFTYFFSHPELVQNFTRIDYTPDFIPKKGDIIVWKQALNGNYGHIAIADGTGNTNIFYSYDQNWTGHCDPCTRIRHYYSFVAGVLRPKDQSKMV